jgi:transcriptional regulator with XRE-family HTH domain
MRKSLWEQQQHSNGSQGVRGLIRGRQLSAGRALINITQEELACAAGLHANSIRYLERQERITTGFSRERVEQAMLGLGVIFFYSPSPGVRLRPMEKEFG